MWYSVTEKRHVVRSVRALHAHEKGRRKMRIHGYPDPLEIFEKCEHGVPIYKKCAECDPIGFRIENGDYD